MTGFAPRLHHRHVLNPLFVEAVRTNHHPRHRQARIAGFEHTANLSTLLQKPVVYPTTLTWDRLSRLAELIDFPLHLVLREVEELVDVGDFETIPKP